MPTVSKASHDDASFVTILVVADRRIDGDHHAAQARNCPGKVRAASISDGFQSAPWRAAAQFQAKLGHR
jgi:hypothetical protein